MKIRIINSVAGIGFSARAGEILDLPDDVAQDLLEAGHAVSVVEQARRRPRDKAVSRVSQDKE
jgi:hypothetical protein